MTKNEKKELARQLMQEAAENHNFDKQPTASMEQLTGIHGQMPTKDIIPWKEGSNSLPISGGFSLPISGLTHRINFIPSI